MSIASEFRRILRLEQYKSMLGAIREKDSLFATYLKAQCARTINQFLDEHSYPGTEPADIQKWQDYIR